MFVFDRLIAVRFEKELSTGTTRPCVFACEDSNGNDAGEFVVKFRSEVRGQATGLLFEFVAAQLALHLSIPMPRPAFIELERALGEATPNFEIANKIRNSEGLNFGTSYLTPGYTTWKVDDPVPMTLVPIACEIMAFDAVIDNADRRVEKPNLLFKEDELVVFDHEMAFAFTRLIGGKTGEWDETRLNFLKDHPLYTGLRGKTVDLRRFEGELRSLQNEKIDEICQVVPPEFGSLYLEQIAEHLRDARDNAGNITESVKRILR